MRRGLKKAFFLVVIAMGSSMGAYAAFQQQGFTSFIENADGSVSFTCEQQCFMLVGPLGDFDSLTVHGTAQGEGQMGYGFLVGQQVYPGHLFLAKDLTDSTFTFKNTQVYSQLPKDQAQIVLLANGNVSTTSLFVKPSRLSMGQKLSQGWNDFWINEPLRPYSINLRYGVNILGTPLFKILYWIFALGFFWALFFRRNEQNRRTAILTLAITLLLFFSARNLLNRTNWTSVALNTYTHAEEDSKVFYDLGDFPLFIEKMREKLSLDDKFGVDACTIYFDAAQEWPYKVHADRVYIKPCEAATEKNTADYIVYYKKLVDPEYASRTQLLEFNGSFLIQNN